MAKKYQNKDKTIHPLVWITMIGLAVILIVTIIMFQPSANEKFFNEYQKTAETWDSYKLPEKNVIKRSSLKEVLAKIEAGELVVVYFGNTTNAISANVIQDVHARLVGNNNPSLSDSPDRLGSDLYTEKLVEVIYHVTVKDADHLKEIAAAINEKLDPKVEDMNDLVFPALVAFDKLDGKDKPEVLKQVSFAANSQAKVVRDFYKDLLEKVKPAA